jgi:c-di-GMP-related signal transduction protein
MPNTTDIFVARQPIFDGSQRVFAYELLFRSGPENYFTPGRSPELQTSHVISNGMFIGLAMLTDNKPAFVNFSREALVGDLALALPPKEIVVEVTESVVADDETMAACHRLKKAGYHLALDRFEDVDERRPLTQFADFIKVDVRDVGEDVAAATATKFKTPTLRLVAEKVESREQMLAAKAQGYDYFQGYFFSRPIIVSTRTIPGFRLNYLRLLAELNRPETDMRRLEEVVKQEASMTFRLLRRVNSAAFGFRLEPSSLRHALVLLGEREIRTCATVWAMADMARDVPSELVVASTLRARLCEMLAPLAQMGDRSIDLFLVGMFSSLDAILEQPMERIVQSLPLGGDVREALLGGRNPLRAVLDCVMAYEQGLWDRASDLALAAGIPVREIPTCYLEAVEWTRDIFQSS